MSANIGVMIVVLIIWFGVFVYLLRLDKRVKELERK
ncbi:MAG TPA: CcmD family protein [Terriglobales bacterium]|nr:CcmD family protein [Terriglobales bacterium]